ncbi:tetratricopeptide repeat protein [Pyxidicoccus xibeiensis]|uniref:tetratricopeptide repeat protein n=1 Tax=Pyxidicoccus xibeiensis TaxID=2906759 RepID=UPI0020A799E7|nr:tetratricopeptide repeat protein [Pyxidicoccus xibeiensis]MCP3144141.1 tetratricopeptide repeat protein [Pyxidicoccus xibeiensis]
MAAKLECPECQGAVGGSDFQCGSCGLLLDADQASGDYVVTEPTIVRALLSPPQRTRTLEVPQPPPKQPTPHDLATARFTVPMDAYTVPHLRAGLDIALQPLQPFEAHIASFIDGVQPVPELARAARLPEIEVKVVLKGLLERGVVELHRVPGAPAMHLLTDELPVLDGNDFLVPEEPMALGDEEPPPPPRAAMARPAAPPPPARTPPPPRAAAPVQAPAPPRPQRPPQPLEAGPTGTAPATAEDFLQRAVRLEREGQVERAIEMLTRAIERAPEAAVLYSKLALILVHQRKDYARAAALLERAVELEPGSAVFQQNLLKVTGLEAAAASERKEQKRGLFARLTGRRS